MRPVLLSALVACAPAAVPEPPPSPPATTPATIAPGPTTLLVILGGVRSAAIAPCGGDAPMPTLSAWIDAGAAWSCDAIAVSPFPIVAARAVLEGRAPGVPASLVPKRRALAASAAASGARTALVSAEPDARAVALDEGFDVVEIASDDRALRHPGLAGILPDVLARAVGGAAAAGRTLLLVTHLRDAADPLPPIPVGPDHPAQGWLAVREADGTRTDLVRGFEAGTLPVDVEDRLRERVRLGAARGLEQTDAALAAIEAALVAAGRGPDRVVVVGDAGFLPGTVGRIGADARPRDVAVRVPLVVRGGGPLPRGPVSAVVAHDLALTGRLPDRLPPVVAGTRGRDPAGAAIDLWLSDGRKLVWRPGADGAGIPGLVVPADDPAETDVRPMPPDADPAAMATFDALIAALAGAP